MRNLLSLYDDSNYDYSNKGKKNNLGQKTVREGLYYLLHANKTTGEISELAFRFGEVICKALQGEEKYERIFLIEEDYRIFEEWSEEKKLQLLAEGWSVLNSFWHSDSNSQ